MPFQIANAILTGFTIEFVLDCEGKDREFFLKFMVCKVLKIKLVIRLK